MRTCIKLVSGCSEEGYFGKEQAKMQGVQGYVVGLRKISGVVVHEKK